MSATSSVGRGIRSYFRGFWFPASQCVERAGGAGHDVRRHARVASRRVDAAMSQQHLNDPRIGAVFQQMGGEAVPQRVSRDPLDQPASLRGLTAGGGQGARSEVPALAPGGEQIFLGTGGAPVTPEHGQQTGRQHDIAIFAAFAFLHAHQHALGIDVAHLQRDGFRDAQSGSVAGHQSGAVLETGNAVEKLAYLFRAENNRQLVGPTHTGKTLLAPRHFQCCQIQELHRGNERVDALRRQFLLVQQVQFVLPDRLQVQVLGAGIVEPREIGDVMEVTSLCGGCEAAQLHVLGEPLSKRCHRGPSEGIVVMGITDSSLMEFPHPPATVLPSQTITAQRFSSL